MSCKLLSGCAIFLLAASMCASANSTDSFSNVALIGSGGTVSGSFTFNSSTDTFSNISLTFGGGFDGVDASDKVGGGTCGTNGICSITWITVVAPFDFVSNTIVFNMRNGQYQDSGSVSGPQGIANFNYQGGFMMVPEGGTTLIYLMLSSLTVLAGILIARKQRRSLLAVRSR